MGKLSYTSASGKDLKFPAGYVIRMPGDNASGYIVARNLYEGDEIRPDHFIAVGHAPIPKLYENVPLWVRMELYR